MRNQKNLKNKMIRKYGCYFLCHLFHFEKIIGRTITERDIDKAYEMAVSGGSMKKNCFVLNRVQLLADIGKSFRLDVSAWFIGGWEKGVVDFFNQESEWAYGEYKANEYERLLIQEYRTITNKQHFVVVATDGTVLYDAYPGSSYVTPETKQATRLYLVRVYEDIPF